MANFGPVTAEIGWGDWGIPANFNRFRDLASLLHRDVVYAGQQNFAGCLAVSWASKLYIQFWGLAP